MRKRIIDGRIMDDGFNNYLIKEKKFKYNNNLVSNDAFDFHLDLYTGYIDRTNNRINEVELDSYDVNGIILHQIFFENIGKDTGLRSEFMIKFFYDNFGGYDEWKSNFFDLAMKIRPSGWCALIFDSTTKKYKNIKIISHDCGVVVNCKIIYLLDLYEHSMIFDYKTNKKEYIEKSFQCMNFDIIEKRIKS